MLLLSSQFYIHLNAIIATIYLFFDNPIIMALISFIIIIIIIKFIIIIIIIITIIK